jgi:serine phosphatase RsbU (regulator of sigma subunit)
MRRRVKPKYLWFKISIGFGMLLGVLLLVQSVLTYWYVTSNLVRQEAVREADRRTQSINRAARLTGTRESADLAPILQELVHEAPQQIAWIRILNAEGTVLAQTEKATAAPSYSPEALAKIFPDRERRPAERSTQTGKVVLVLNPLRVGPPPGRRPNRTPAEFAEIAIYLDGVSTHFGVLRVDLILGCTAAIALLAAVLFISLRFRNYMRGKHIEEELSLARRVQHDLFPNESSLAHNLAFAARCVPAYQVGGDLYDVFETDHGEIALVLGDVSGKGLPAALLMGVVQGAVRASRGTGSAANHEEAAERLNHLLCMKTARERFVSLFWCYFDPAKPALHYVNAGHLPPLLIRDGVDTQEVIRLEEGGPVLGLLPGARYTQASVSIETGDLLVVFSDGILEAANELDQEFGEDGLIAAIARNRNKPPGEICAAILADVKSFLGKQLPQDDQTLLVVRLAPAVRDAQVAGIAQATARLLR